MAFPWAAWIVKKPTSSHDEYTRLPQQIFMQEYSRLLQKSHSLMVGEFIKADLTCVTSIIRYGHRHDSAVE